MSLSALPLKLVLHIVKLVPRTAPTVTKDGSVGVVFSHYHLCLVSRVLYQIASETLYKHVVISDLRAAKAFRAAWYKGGRLRWRQLRHIKSIHFGKKCEDGEQVSGSFVGPLLLELRQAGVVLRAWSATGLVLGLPTLAAIPGKNTRPSGWGGLPYTD